MIREINKISIIGLGLIGSSILHAFKIKFENKFQVFAYDKNLKHRNIIKKMEIADKVCDNIIDSVVDADLLPMKYEVPGLVVILLGDINLDNCSAVLGIIVAKLFFLNTIIP